MATLNENVFNRITGDFQVLAKIILQQFHFIYQLLEDNKTENTYTDLENNERLIDSLEVKIRDEVIHTIVLYNPRATNLRKIISYYDMTAYLERIGDLTVNISRFLRRTALEGPLFQEYKKDLVKMFSQVENMTQNAIFAFTCEDILLAKNTIESDDKTDDLYHRINNKLPDSSTGHTLSRQDMMDLLSINGLAYNMERIGDNATNIAEAAIYLIEGKNIKHWDKSSEEPLRAGSEG